jgi:hypothetical protein
LAIACPSAIASAIVAQDATTAFFQLGFAKKDRAAPLRTFAARECQHESMLLEVSAPLLRRRRLDLAPARPAKA